MKEVQHLLADAYSLLCYSEKLLEGIESVPLEELFRTLQIIRKNIRDAKNYINAAEYKLDSITKVIDIGPEDLV